MCNMIETFKKTIGDHALIRKGDKVVVGVSGGPDSMALLHMMINLKREYGLKLVVAHQIGYFDLKKRALDESYGKLVETYCKMHGIPFRKHVVDHTKDSNKEEVARNDRYRLFDKVAKAVGANKVALAHNYDDNVETVLLNMIRGTGVRGLAGIPYKRDKYIRPVLDISKNDLESYCKKSDIPFIKDYANKMEDPLRNRVRQRLLPFILKEVSESASSSVSNMSKVMKKAHDYLDSEVSAAIKSVSKGSGSYDLEKWKALHPFMRLEVLKWIAAKGGVDRDLTSAHLGEVEDMLMRSKTGSEKTIGGKLTVKKGYGSFSAAKERKTTRKSVGKIRISKARKVSKSAGRNVAFVDGSKVELPMRAVKFSAGDRFFPTGMRGSKKVKDYFIDEKVPAGDRPEVPIMKDKKGRVVWIAGMRMDRRFKASLRCKNPLKIEYIR